MPYGTPDSDEMSATYSVQIAYTPPAVNVPMTLTLDLAAVADQGVTAASADEAFQAVMDLIAGSAGFEVVAEGRKRYTATVPVTTS